MITSYFKCIIDDFSKEIKDKYDNFTVMNGAEQFNLIASQVANGTANYPMVAIAYTYEYITDNSITNYETIDTENHLNKYDINFYEAMPVEFYCTFAIITVDTSHTVSMEEYILSLYSTPRKLTINHPSKANEKILFSIVYDDSIKISRKQSERNYIKVYQSTITLKCECCVSFAKTFHQAELELKETLKDEIVKRAAALESVKANFTKQNEVANQEKIDYALKILDDQLNCLSNITTYSKLYEVMQSQKCNTEKAIEIIKKKIAEEQEKAEAKAKRIEKEKIMYEARVKRVMRQTIPQGTDDTILNSYTDAVVDDMRIKLAQNPQISIYGGSNLMDWMKMYIERKATYPTVLITANCQFSFLLRNYINEDNNDNMVAHKYSSTALPLNYGVRIDIIANDENDAKLVEKKLRELYGNKPITIAVPDEKLPGEKRLIPISITEQSKSEMKFIEGWNNDICHILLYSIAHLSVYYTREYNKEELKNNHLLQLRLLQQAQFALLCSSKIKNEVIGQLDTDYKDLVEQKLSWYELGKSDEYKKLKSCIKHKKPVDRRLFDSVLKKITDVYPLYEKMMSGTTYEQIKLDLTNYAEFFSQHWHNLCDLLSLPQAFNLKTQYIKRNNNLRNSEGLKYCITEMIKGGASQIDSIASSYEITLEFELEDYFKKQAARATYREESSDYSSSGGFISNTASTAIGVAIGNKMSGEKQRKDGKKNLFGTSACQRCNSPKNSYDRLTCLGCPASSRCTKQFY